MKKYINITMLVALAITSLSLSSCKNEVDEIFSEDAVTRLAEERDRYLDILTDKGGKWQMEYFATDREQGYVYVMTFAKNGSVTISGKNKWISYQLPEANNGSVVYGSEVSLWDIITDSGPVLTFNTYNRVFHVFADPADIPSMSDQEEVETGYGHEGDYEFELMKYSGDTLYVEGKKYGVKMIMTRLAADTNDEDYLNEVSFNVSSTYSAKIPRTYMILPDGKRWFVYFDASSSSLSMYAEGADSISTTESHNVIFTHDGMAFMTPHTFTGNPGHVYELHRFELQEDGSLIHVDEDGTTLLTADPVADQLMDTRFTWQVDNLSMVGGKYEDLLATLASELTAFNKSTLRYIQISYDKNENCFNLIFNAKKSGAGTAFNPKFYFTIERKGDTQVKLNMRPTGDRAAEQFIVKCPTMRAIVDELGAATLNLEPNSVLSPIQFTMSEQGNDDNYMLWNLIK